MFREINHACSENNTNHINALCWQNAVLFFKVHTIAIVFETADKAAQYTTYCLLWNSRNIWNFSMVWNETSYTAFGGQVRSPSSGFPLGATAHSGPGPLRYRDFTIKLKTPHWVGLLWTSDQPHAETSTWQHTTLTRDGHRSYSPSKRTAADPLLRTHGPLGSSVFRLTSSETIVIVSD